MYTYVYICIYMYMCIYKCIYHAYTYIHRYRWIGRPNLYVWHRLVKSTALQCVAVCCSVLQCVAVCVVCVVYTGQIHIPDTCAEAQDQ